MQPQRNMEKKILKIAFGVITFIVSILFFQDVVQAQIIALKKNNPSYLQSTEMDQELFFGSEMTVSSDDLLASYPKNGNNVQVTNLFAESLLEKIRVALIEKYLIREQEPPFIRVKRYHSHWSRPALVIQYSDGFQITIFPDPGVFEMNTPPSSVNQIESRLHLIQEDYLDIAKNFGLAPAMFTGSGHIHIDIRRLHPITLRNFLADFYSATGLAAGALNDDIFNSIGVGEFPLDHKSILRKAFAVFDAIPSASVDYLVSGITSAYQIGYGSDLPEYRKFRTSTRSTKYHAISFNSFSSLGTIEIRSIRPQQSAESYLKLIKLFKLKMQKADQLRQQGIIVPLREMPSLRGNPQAVLADFDKYLMDVGLRIDDYKEFIMPWWQAPGAEFDQYRSSQRRSLSCRKAHLTL